MSDDSGTFKNANGNMNATLLLLSDPVFIDAVIGNETVTSPKNSAKPTVPIAPSLSFGAIAIGLQLAGTM
jgi:hypothetical protein